MQTVRLLVSIGARNVGDLVGVPDDEARRLVERGAAVLLSGSTTTEPPAQSEGKALSSPHVRRDMQAPKRK